MIQYNGLMLDYYGEQDERGDACGKGFAFDVTDPQRCYEGTFYKNVPHGLCKLAQITLLTKLRRRNFEGSIQVFL